MPNRTQGKKTLPSFSIILETGNLATADLDHPQRRLENLANQTLSATRANAFLSIDPGPTPAEVRARRTSRPSGTPSRFVFKRALHPAGTGCCSFGRVMITSVK
ncbi:hypothetical protein SCOR_10755 [Sulfidibacter corallicola]